MNLQPLGSFSLLMLMFGCRLDLPEISRSHPAHAEAPRGQIYATPAVLEVRPLPRLPHQPTTRAAPTEEDHSMDMEHDHGSGHHASHSSQPAGTQPSTQAAPHTRPSDSGKPVQQMQREGQRHE